MRLATAFLVLMVALDAGQCDIVADLNSRFAAGKPNNNLSLAGVLLHQFDHWDGGDDQLDEHWLPCPAHCYGAKQQPCWCAQYGDRWSASIINAKTPRGPDGSIVLYSNNTGGLVLSTSHNSILCSYPRDGGTSARICNPTGNSSKCVPGCFTEATNGHACWCDEVAPATGCPEPSHSNVCAWKPSGLANMMQAQIRVAQPLYNEVVVDAITYAANVPTTLEAIFFLASDECHAPESSCEAFARKVYSTFMQKFPTSSMPLLKLNLSAPLSPFTAAA